MSAAQIVVVIVGWTLTLPLMLIGYSGLLEWAKRIGRRHPTEAERQPLQLAQPTLGERLRADQRRHQARWVNHEGDDVA